MHPMFRSEEKNEGGNTTAAATTSSTSCGYMVCDKEPGPQRDGLGKPVSSRG